jgi:hypothetical protein
MRAPIPTRAARTSSMRGARRVLQDFLGTRHSGWPHSPACCTFSGFREPLGPASGLRMPRARPPRACCRTAPRAVPAAAACQPLRVPASPFQPLRVPAAARASRRCVPAAACQPLRVPAAPFQPLRVPAAARAGLGRVLKDFSATRRSWRPCSPACCTFSGFREPPGPAGQAPDAAARPPRAAAAARARAHVRVPPPRPPSASPTAPRPASAPARVRPQPRPPGLTVSGADYD